MFQWLGSLVHKIVYSGMSLDSKRTLARHWKFNSFLLDRRNFRQHVLTRLVQREFGGAGIRNKWWERLKDCIRSFTTEFSQSLALDKCKRLNVIKESDSGGGWG